MGSIFARPGQQQGERLENLLIGGSPKFNLYPFNLELLRGITDY